MNRYLLAPGLFGPPPAAVEIAALPRLPGIERLVARADRELGPPGYLEAVFSLFGVDPVDGELPSAALCHAAESGMPGSGWLMHADPVHLRPDQDRLLLFDSRHLDLDGDESAEFVAAFNAHFAADGLQLVATSATHWYLQSDTPPQITTTPLGEVTGRNVDRFLPAGARAGYWRQLLNEVQMLFYGLPANARREQQGRLPVSGLWLSGCGRPGPRGNTSIGRIEGDQDRLVAALVAHAQRRGDDLLRVELASWYALLDADAAAWTEALERFERLLSGWLADGQTFTLITADGARYRWRAQMRYRLWRRIRPFPRLLSVSHTGRARGPGAGRLQAL